MSHDPAVESALDSGQLATRELIRFELPGKSVGYHMGGRPYTYNGLVYRPNRWLQMGDMQGNLGVSVTAREIAFANVPVDDANDAIASIEQYAYINAPVIITHLAGAPQSNDVYGILVSHLYEINDVRYEDGAADRNGERTMTMTIELEAPGRSAPPLFVVHSRNSNLTMPRLTRVWNMRRPSRRCQWSGGSAVAETRFEIAQPVIDAELAKPYAYGVADCFVFGCRIVDAFDKHRRMVTTYAGTYRTLMGAQKALRKHGFKRLSDLFENHLTPCESLSSAQFGDLVILECGDGEHIGVCVGARFLTKTQHGPSFHDLNAVKAAFRT